MLKQTIKMAASSSLAVSLLFAGGGVASAHQQNYPKHDKVPGNVSVCTVWNNNSTTVNNANTQKAKTGKATASGNSKGGSASTGNAKNDNTTGITVNSSNNNNCCDCGATGTVEGLGVNTDPVKPASTVKVQTVVNNNSVAINNSSTQNAASGNALVVCNTDSGNASTGNANNSNGTTITVTSANN